MKPSLALALSLVLGGLAPAAAQTSSAPVWPTKTVKIVVPFGPGSTPDMVARLIAERLQQKLGQTFVIENKPGASGNLGTDAVAKAEPDGATIGISIGGPLAINTLLFAKLPYDPAKDIAPVTQLVTQPSALAVNAEPRRQQRGRARRAAQARARQIQFRLDRQRLALAPRHGGDRAQERHQDGAHSLSGLARGDDRDHPRRRADGVPAGDLGHAAGADRQGEDPRGIDSPGARPFLPDIPTLKESGIDVEADAWMGLIAPGRTPPAIVAKIHAEVVEAIKSPQAREKLATQLMEPVGNSPAEFRKVIEGEIARWSPIIKAADIKIN